MKYIILKADKPVERYLPIIFPNEFVHSEVAKHMQSMLNRIHELKTEVHSAGEVHISIEKECWGHSETLRIKSKNGDTEIINEFDYFHGIK